MPTAEPRAPLDAQHLRALIRPDRLRDLTAALVAIPSPTGQARECTEFYAQHLAGLGLEVTLETGHYPDHPSAVARLRGRGAPCVQFDGHTDTVPLPHPPLVVTADRIVGRGAADMKGPLAAVAEVAAVLVEAGVDLPGDLLITAHDLHEAPGGLGETITDLCRRGIHGDVAIVAELGRDVVPVAGRGMAIFELTVRRAGELCHEVTGAPNPLDTAQEVIARLFARRAELAAVSDPWVGPETIFLGQCHGGSFYNQVPTEVFLNGTWRFSPRRTFDEVQAELQRLLESVARPPEITFDLRFFQVRPSFSLDPGEPVIAALQGAYEAVHGQPLPLAAAAAVCDVPVLIREAGIPCLGHGPVSHGAHGEPEWIAVEDLVRTTGVYLELLARFWQSG
ncbi:MAG: M20/M25/M40 family metallo-hydrolase [Fimbriimonadaceae bacterium]|nr:M20/M25/M40 family metallo-hydrolase [Fimbriimonadaceae bacterium]